MPLARIFVRFGSAPVKPRTLSSLLAATILALFAAGCQTAPKPDPAALHTAIEAANRQFMDAFSRKDAAAIGMLYAEDALVLPPGAPEVAGRAAIESMWKSVLALPLAEFELKTSDVGGGVETAWESGRYRMLQNDGSLSDAGKYVVVWKQVEGGWKVYRDIWNSDVPSATPAPETPTTPPRK
jgi:uncharacterized protein (TIGR02246 family)